MPMPRVPVSNLVRPSSARAAHAVNATALFSGLDDGSGEWENIPLTIRVAMRHLLSQSNASREERDEARARCETLTVRVEVLEVELLRRGETVAALARDLATRPTRADVAAKGDADAVLVANARAAEASGGAAAAAAAAECVARDLITLRADADAGVAAASGAANEARLAVNTALSAVAALLARGDPERKVLSQQLDALVEETREVKAVLSRKAVATRVGAALAALAARVDKAETTITAALGDEVDAALREAAAQLGGLRADVAALIKGGVSAAVAPLRDRMDSIEAVFKTFSRKLENISDSKKRGMLDFVE